MLRAIYGLLMLSVFLCLVIFMQSRRKPSGQPVTRFPHSRLRGLLLSCLPCSIANAHSSYAVQILRELRLAFLHRVAERMCVAPWGCVLAQAGHKCFSCNVQRARLVAITSHTEWLSFRVRIFHL